MNKGQLKPKPRTEKPHFFFLLPFVCSLLIFLTGCVNYDVGVNFEGQYRGTIVQRIKLGEQVINLSPSATKEWLASIELRARNLKGKTKIVSPREVLITIPFNNGKDLVAKLNKFFNPNDQKVSQLAKVKEPEIGQLYSEISLGQNNLLLLQRDRLSLAVDLRAFNVFSEPNKLAINPSSAIDLEFNLNTPWGAKANLKKNFLTPQVRNDGHQLVWRLKPGKINYLEAVFWLPSPLGIGAVIIFLLVLAGFYLKYQSFPWTNQPPSDNLSLTKG
ncbi:MAG: DUF3153 domain-containing protein [Prochloraceae cyanobacterium]